MWHSSLANQHRSYSIFTGLSRVGLGVLIQPMRVEMAWTITSAQSSLPGHFTRPGPAPLEMKRIAMKRPVENYIVELNPGSVDLTILRNPRARRMTLRVDPKPGAATLVAPPFLDTRTAMRFVRENAGWLTEKLAQQSQPVPFAHGAEIPFRGRMHRIEGLRTSRGLVVRRNQTLFVPGGREHMPRRLTEWLKEEARVALLAATTGHAQALGGKLARVTVRDQKTRWGSCSPDGNISFSWRLIMAPPVILDYVAAHEAAHLVQMNHSPAFWKLVARRVKDTSSAYDWLRLHGPDLHRYGAGH